MIDDQIKIGEQTRSLRNLFDTMLSFSPPGERRINFIGSGDVVITRRFRGAKT
jgi:hypothetical protein